VPARRPCFIGQSVIERRESNSLRDKNIAARFDRCALQRPQYRVSFAHKGFVQRRDDKSAIGPGQHQAFFFKGNERFTHRCSAGADSLREADFVQSLGGPDRSRNDQLAQCVSNLIARADAGYCL
jgi:hypothetical protein